MGRWRKRRRRVERKVLEHVNAMYAGVLPDTPDSLEAVRLKTLERLEIAYPGRRVKVWTWLATVGGLPTIQVRWEVEW